MEYPRRKYYELSFRTTTEIHLPFLSVNAQGPEHMLELKTVLDYCRVDRIDGILFVGGGAQSVSCMTITSIYLVHVHTRKNDYHWSL